MNIKKIYNFIGVSSLDEAVLLQYSFTIRYLTSIVSVLVLCSTGRCFCFRRKRRPFSLLSSNSSVSELVVYLYV